MAAVDETEAALAADSAGAHIDTDALHAAISTRLAVSPPAGVRAESAQFFTLYAAQCGGAQDMQSRDADLNQERMRASAAVAAHEADATAVPPTIEIQPITSRLARVHACAARRHAGVCPGDALSRNAIAFCLHLQLQEQHSAAQVEHNENQRQVSAFVEVSDRPTPMNALAALLVNCGVLYRRLRQHGSARSRP